MLTTYRSSQEEYVVFDLDIPDWCTMSPPPMPEANKGGRKAINDVMLACISASNKASNFGGNFGVEIFDKFGRRRFVIFVRTGHRRPKFFRQMLNVQNFAHHERFEPTDQRRQTGHIECLVAIE
uniref:Uncharacterized protein n=1 Tax=Romanomermis culicivorax TaxID=13658 RepID=A0A915HQM6_ROMCU